MIAGRRQNAGFRHDARFSNRPIVLRSGDASERVVFNLSAIGAELELRRIRSNKRRGGQGQVTALASSADARCALAPFHLYCELLPCLGKPQPIGCVFLARLEAREFTAVFGLSPEFSGVLHVVFAQ